MGVMDKFLNYMKLTEDEEDYYDDDYYDEEPEEMPKKNFRERTTQRRK